MALLLLPDDWHQRRINAVLVFLVSPKATTVSDLTSKGHSYYPPTFDEKYKHKKTKRELVVNFDFIGLILLVGGLLIFLIGISWGGSYYPWKSTHVAEKEQQAAKKATKDDSSYKASFLKAE